MSTRNSSNCSNSALKGSGEQPTRTGGLIRQPMWERLPDALQRVMDANGISKDEAKAAICQALSDRSINFCCRLKTHGPITSKAVLDESAFQIPLPLEPHHLDWDASRPTKTWVVHRGKFYPAGHWRLAWIELSKSDVTSVLCAARRNTHDGTSIETTGLSGSERAVTRRRGPRAKKLQGTIEAMKNDIGQGTLTADDLNDMREKNLAARYGVSRDTARKARNVVLSAFVEL